MAVSRIWPVKVNLSYTMKYAANPEKTNLNLLTNTQLQGLADVIAYAKDEEKTERELFVLGINCNAETAREQFVTVKQQYGKTDGIQAYHGYLSFKENEVTPERALQIGQEFAQKAWGDRFQVLVAVHMNTKHLHCHFVVNSVSFKDGKRLHGEEKAWFKLRELSDAICEAHSLSVVTSTVHGRRPDPHLTHLYEAGMPSRYDVVRKVIDDAIAESSTLRDLEYLLRQKGYICQFSQNRKNWTVIPKGYKKPIRLFRLGEEYTNEQILRRLEANIGKIKLLPFHNGTRPRQYRLPTREDKIRRHSGIYRLYLYYCYRMGTLPAYKRPTPSQLPASLQEDIWKLDQITQEVRMMGREHISTDAELAAYKHSLETELEQLKQERANLRTLARREQPESERRSLREQAHLISEKMKYLRSEISLCDDIEQRSSIIQERVNELAAEEQTKERRRGRYE